MHDAEKNGKIPESYRPRNYNRVTFREHKTGFSIAGLGLVGVIMICWNIFAVSTWISALFHISIPFTMNNQQEVVHNYISQNKALDAYIMSCMQMISTEFSPNNTYSIDEIKSKHDTLLALKSGIETDKTYLLQLKGIYNELCTATDQAMIFGENNYNKRLTQEDVNNIGNIMQKVNDLNIQKESAVIELLKKSNMHYTISQDGSIQYQYQKAN
jgi:hypothetical protein